MTGMGRMAEAAQGEGGLVFKPLEQFTLEPLFGHGPIHWYTPTNATLWMGIAIVCVYLLLVARQNRIDCCFRSRSRGRAPSK